MSNETPTHSLVQGFLDRFNQANDTEDPASLAGCFAETFLVGDARGARPVPRVLFLQALPARRKMFDDAGISATRLEGWRFDELDEHYVLLHGTWRALMKDGSDGIELSSSFLLHRDGDDLTAVAYINHRGL